MAQRMAATRAPARLAEIVDGLITGEGRTTIM
jgi:hypothetical protein